MNLNPFFGRLTLLTGPEAAQALERSRVMVFGLGGVGSWCAEALARSGIGNICLVDSDVICDSNINRQVQASTHTIGRLKSEVLEERLKEINPSCGVTSIPRFFSRETSGIFDFNGTDYVIDAIDTLGSKLDLIETAQASGACLFSCMGMARKLDPTLIRTADIWETSGCPLARLVRQGLRKRNFIGHFTAVYSDECLDRRPDSGDLSTAPDLSPDMSTAKGDRGKKIINGSAVTVTAAAGMVLASLVIRDVCARYAPKPGAVNLE